MAGSTFVGPPRQLIVVTAINTEISLPAGYKIDSWVMRNTTANAVTGGIRVGTAAAGTQVITAQAVGASALLQVADASLTLKAFSKTLAQALFIEAVTNWNSASVTHTINISPFG